jgi:hypothetical protein
MIIGMTMKSAPEYEVLTEVMEAVETTDVMDLIVFNDDVNTFDHVINTLIRVCNHTKEQAEQPNCLALEKKRLCGWCCTSLRTGRKIHLP